MNPLRVWRQRGRRPLDCAEVARELQAFVDGQSRPRIHERVAEHLACCRWCGFEAATYREIKSALARHEPVDRETLARVRAFAESLLHDEPSGGTGTPAV
ncbi:zf-HC2 domain-containing protein [Streptomyces sp. NPDC051940]|uniref:zf-HC2 domain-containing protein n=1 Tax=Streptomyces sp. NPDC051940 TaxID=3155675 RepID=UPI00341C2C85